MKADFYCYWHPEYGWNPAITSKPNADLKPHGSWIEKPVCLIAPEELDELRRKAQHYDDNEAIQRMEGQRQIKEGEA